MWAGWQKVSPKKNVTRDLTKNTNNKCKTNCCRWELNNMKNMNGKRNPEKGGKCDNF